MGVMFQWDAPTDSGEIPLDSSMPGRDSPRDSPVEIGSGVRCFLEERGPPQNRGMVGTLEAVELASHKIEDSFGELRGHEVTGNVAGYFSCHWKGFYQGLVFTRVWFLLKFARPSWWI